MTMRLSNLGQTRLDADIPETTLAPSKHTVDLDEGPLSKALPWAVAGLAFYFLFNSYLRDKQRLTRRDPREPDAVEVLAREAERIRAGRPPTWAQ